MAQEKKLKRGLQDVSPLFLKMPSANALPSSGIASERPSSPQVFDKSVKGPSTDSSSVSGSRIFTCSVQSEESFHFLMNNMPFVNALNAIYSEAILISSPLSRNDRNHAAHSGIDRLRHFELTSYHLEHIIHASRKHDIRPAQEAEQPAEDIGLMIDPCLFRSSKEVLEFLNFMIIHVSSDQTDSVLTAYQSLVGCLRYNPRLQFYLLVSGKNAEDMTPVIYERFSDISSRFLAHQVDLLGWADENSIRLNHDLLLDRLPVHIVQEGYKKCLLECVREELSIKSASLVEA